MNKLSIVLLSISLLTMFLPKANAKVYSVSSQLEFTSAHSSAAANDSIIWESGIYKDIYMNISKGNLFIAAKELGNTIFTGNSYVKITSDYIILQGFQFVNGDIGSSDVINTSGSYNTFTQLNIRAYKSYKYLVIREACQYVNVTYCNFENRINLDDKNILSILVDANKPGYHKVQHCSFKNFDGTGNDLGIEPIRIGLSTQAKFISRSLVEYCYFTQCNGDGEIISSKASQNVYRYNTFENNPLSELVLRHGSEGVVYGNFFLNGKGGVRVREGQNHYIYNNYFYEIDDRAIYLQNESSDPLDNINIAFNTVFDCAELILGSSGSYKPTNVTIANNIFANPDSKLFEQATSTEKWIGNIAFGTLGITAPSLGITIVDPNLIENSEGYFGLAESSPAINAAQIGYAPLPQFEGMDPIDTNVLMDLMQQNRPANIAEKDLGCSEHPHNILIQPIANESNTGPSYNTSFINSVATNLVNNEIIVKIAPNPVGDQINLLLKNHKGAHLVIEVFSLDGRKLKTLFDEVSNSNSQNITKPMNDIPAGTYNLIIQSSLKHRNSIDTSSLKFIKI